MASEERDRKPVGMHAEFRKRAKPMQQPREGKYTRRSAMVVPTGNKIFDESRNGKAAVCGE